MDIDEYDYHSRLAFNHSLGCNVISNMNKTNAKQSKKKDVEFKKKDNGKIEEEISQYKSKRYTTEQFKDSEEENEFDRCMKLSMNTS